MIGTNSDSLLKESQAFDAMLNEKKVPHEFVQTPVNGCAQTQQVWSMSAFSDAERARNQCKAEEALLPQAWQEG